MDNEAGGDVSNAVTAKKSNTWYLLPIFLGIIGGIIAYFVLRNSDSRKARNCLIVGIVVLVLGIVVLAYADSTLTDEDRERIAVEREVRELQKEIEKEKAEEAKILKEEELVAKIQKEKLQKETQERKAQELAESIRIQEEREKTEQEKKLDTEEEVLEFIQNYKGKDNTGLTLDETLGTLMNVLYPGEDILSSPSTTGYYVASRDYDKEISDRYWKVEVKIQTYRETTYFEWIIDTETNLVYPGDELSKSVLDILDSFDK